MNRNYTKILSFLLFIFFSLAGTSLFAQLKADFTLTSDSVCASALDTFHNTSSGGTEPYTYYWDYGNKNTATGSLGATNYYTPGTYYIKLRVTDANNNKDSVTKKIIVLDIPKAYYSAVRIGCGPVYFKAGEDSASNIAISKYLWTGNGSPGNGPFYHTGDSASYLYLMGGTYHYSLMVTAANGCTTVYSDSIKVASYPGISLPYDTSVCKNAFITITATAMNGTPPYNIWWGRRSANITGPTIHPTIKNDTAFVVHISDAIGCTNYDSMQINALPLPNALWTIRYSKDTFYLKAKKSGFKDYSYAWSLFTVHGLKMYKEYGPDVWHVLLTDTIYDILLIVTDTNGCTSYYDSTVDVARLGILQHSPNNFQVSIYPNPFYSTTTLKYNLSHQSFVSVEMYDITGKKVAFISSEMEEPGLKQIDFDAEKYHLNPGVYVLKLTTDEGNTNLHIVKL